MIKRAYHRIQYSDGVTIEGPLVLEFDEDGSLYSYHPLREEEPNTEWMGGCFYIDN